MEGLDFLGAVSVGTRRAAPPTKKKSPSRSAGGARKASRTTVAVAPGTPESGSIDAPLASEVKAQMEARISKRRRSASAALTTPYVKPRETTRAKPPATPPPATPPPATPPPATPPPATPPPATPPAPPPASEDYSDYEPPIGPEGDRTPMPEGEEEFDYNQFQDDEAASYVPPTGPNESIGPSGEESYYDLVEDEEESDEYEEDYYDLVEDELLLEEELDEYDDLSVEAELEAEDEMNRVDAVGFDWMSLASGAAGGLANFGGGAKPSANDGQKLEALLAKQKADEELRRAQEQATALKTYLMIAVSGAIGAALYFTSKQKR